MRVAWLRNVKLPASLPPQGHSPSGREERPAGARRRMIGITSLGAVVALASTALLWNFGVSPELPIPASNGSNSAEPSAEPVRGAGAPLVYRHSVIPGGVRSSEELERAIRTDPVVAAHYEGIDPQALREEVLPRAREAYVSYRLGDDVYWTKDRLLLPAGERVLTNGTTTIRVRCGNAVSDVPMMPVARVEPAAHEFDLLSDPRVVAAVPGFNADPSAALVGGSLPQPLPASIPSNPGSGPQSSPAPPLFIPSDLIGARSIIEGIPGGADTRSTSSSSAATSPSPRSGPVAGLTSEAVADPDPQPNTMSDPGAGPGRVRRSDPDGDPGRGAGPGPGPEVSGGPNLPLNPTSRQWDAEQAPLPAPEPTTLVLVGLGAAACLVRHLRSRRSRRQP
jgi:hypothetical protein